MPRMPLFSFQAGRFCKDYLVNAQILYAMNGGELLMGTHQVMCQMYLRSKIELATLERIEILCPQCREKATLPPGSPVPWSVLDDWGMGEGGRKISCPKGHLILKFIEWMRMH